MRAVSQARGAGSLADTHARPADRGPRWGSIEIWVERFGAVRYRLTVFPPGTDRVTRRWLRACHAWRGGGLIGCVVFAILLMVLVPPAAALAITSCAYVSVLLLIRRGAGVARVRTRRLIGVDLAGYSTARERERCARLLQAAAIMDEADRSMRAGELSPVAHEALWHRVYDDIGQLIADDAPLRVHAVR